MSFLLAFVILYRGNIIASIFFISFGGLLVSILRQVFFLHIVNLLIGATVGLFFCIAVLYEVEIFRLGKA